MREICQPTEKLNKCFPRRGSLTLPARRFPGLTASLCHLAKASPAPGRTGLWVPVQGPRPLQTLPLGAGPGSPPSLLLSPLAGLPPVRSSSSLATPRPPPKCTAGWRLPVPRCDLLVCAASRAPVLLAAPPGLLTLSQHQLPTRGSTLASSLPGPWCLPPLSLSRSPQTRTVR